MDVLHITTIQSHLHWESVSENLAHFDAKISTMKEQTDVIVLPEMFTTGFTMIPNVLAEDFGGPGFKWMQKIAAEKKCAVVGSIAVRENNCYYNRLYWVNSDGTFYYYNKRHLFRMGGEHNHYTAGTEKLIVEYKGWKICPLVCYDLRFPVWSRNTKQQPYDLLLYVANWPEARNYPWQQLLIARAIENQCYVAGVNRIGLDGNKVAHSGNTSIFNAKGEKINNTNAHEESMETVSLSLKSLNEFRTIFPVMLDADDFSL